MKNALSFMKSTRSILAVMAMILLFIVVIGSLNGATISNEVLTLIATTVGSVITAYFGKRNSNEDIGK